ncbi:cell division protein FtsA [Legionella sp. W05-934-2]|jgi:cell division protein FtsA|uniref:cell division protein FtsA n=1 Tax=Legionella sp. W05-934-2 TaxID=1198649 RepID=UPI003461E476
MAKKQDKQIITGLDIGTSKIVALIAEVSEDGSINVIGMGRHPSRGLKRGVVVDIEATVNSIQRAIEEAELMANCEVSTVYAGIAGSHIRSLNSHGIVAIKDKEVTRADVERVIEAAKAVAIPADQKILHVLPQEFIIDNQGSIREPLGMAGVRLEANVHIVTGAVSAAQNIVKCVNLCGLQVEDIILEQLASSHSVLTDDEKELGVCLIDIGGGTTDIAVFSQGAIQHTAVIPIAGDQVTNDIAMALRTPAKSAEQIKIQYATTIPSHASTNDMIEVSPASNDRAGRKIAASMLAEVVYARYEELYMLVNNELLRSGFADRIPAGLVITGGGSCVNGALSLAEMSFNMPVRHGLTHRLPGMPDESISPTMATSVGLLIHGFNHKQETGYNTPRLRPQAKNVWAKMRAWFQGNF